MVFPAFTPPPPRSELIWAAIDFDGTLCKSTWSVDNPLATPGEPIIDNVVKLHDLVDKGYKIIVHTSRSWTDYEVVEAWMRHYGVPFNRIVCGKLLAKVYVDDRAVYSEDPSWDPEERVVNASTSSSV